MISSRHAIGALCALALPLVLSACGSSGPCAPPSACTARGQAVLEEGGAPERALPHFVLGCEAGDAGACQRLAVLYAEGRGVHANLDAAMDYHGRACDMGSAQSCYALGLAHATGRGRSQDDALASSLLERACAADVVDACLELSRLRGEPLGLERLGQMCEGGSEEACGRAGAALMYGDGVDADPARARELLARSTSPRATYQLALSHLRGDLDSHDEAKAVELLDAACEGGHGAACRLLAEATSAGREVDKDPTRAGQIRFEACVHGDLESCQRVGGRRGRPRLEGDRLTEAERQCAAGVGEGCVALGLARRFGIGLKADEMAAGDALRSACDHGAPIGCVLLAQMKELGRGPDPGPDKATALLMETCEQGFEPACRLHGTRLVHGRRIKGDLDAGIALLDASCERGHAASCAAAAHARVAHAKPPQTDAARPQLQSACTRGDANACFQLARLHDPEGNIGNDAQAAEDAYATGCRLFNGTACNNGAWMRCYHRDVCDDTALRWARLGVAHSPSGSHWDTLGVVLCGVGEDAEAKEAFEKGCARGVQEDCGRTCDKYPGL